MDQLFNDFNIDIKKSLIALLITMSEADGNYDNNEIALIKDTGLKMGLTLDEIKSIKNNPKSFEFKLPDSINERMKMFTYLLFMIRIDGKIAISEKELLRNIGFRLCLNIDLLNDLLLMLEKYQNKVIPDNLIADKVKKYLN